MDELYRVGERVSMDQQGHGGLAGTIDPALEDLLGGGGDIEQYLQSYEQMLSQGINQGPQLNQVDAEGGITVRPDPGFVIKTRDVASGMKIFLNIVSNEHIESPHMKSFEEIEGEQGCRVPLSIGTPVEDFDKKNEPCVTYDLVANPEIVKECKETPNFRDTICQLCLAAITQKYKIELDQKYKLPKMTYKGEHVQVQRIRKQKQSQIQEVASEVTDPKSAAREEDPKAAKKPEFCIYYAKVSDDDAPRALPYAFGRDWGAPPEDAMEAQERDFLYGCDLPVYRVNAFAERVRGSMKNEKDRLKAEEEEALAAEEGSPPERETKRMLSGRTCVVQVRMPDLDRHVAALKQFSVEVSDECLRIGFPLLPRTGRSAYAPLTLWWPRLFHSAQATADWDTKGDMLVVTLPTEAPVIEGTEAFDLELLDAVF
eukprot:TRINITY_DN10105_c0_g1_i1.p1 TRINITY_DN10105_c0_g1~~TRINITY_DN10105_c0_g1_i1.p1  ORF type:complete len:428 (-),score=101.60 TRINITY_DN10105_c0_g1_i1:418-1701(-)